MKNILLQATRFRCLVAPWLVVAAVMADATCVAAQTPPYDVYPEVEPPYYRVRYEAETSIEAASAGQAEAAGKLAFAVSYTLWLPPDVEQLRGVMVHQHGCGEGSCRSGLTGAHDLHWQALARQHACALLSPAYEQPDGANCQLWCDPRNGSSRVFQQSLVDLAQQTGHRELATVPWALWGHSGGGHWAGGMAMMHPDRVVAAWLRSGVPLLEPNPQRSEIRSHELPEAALRVPMMCNLGADEGYRSSEGRFAGVWPANQVFFKAVRGRGGLIGIAIDPLTSHECGNQRYLAIPWLDACLAARLPRLPGEALREMPEDGTWLVSLESEALLQPGSTDSQPSAINDADELAVWLPNERVATAWLQYVRDTAVEDPTPPPAPTNVRVEEGVLRWEATADLESGLAGFEIMRNGQLHAELKGSNPFGRPLFQNLQYSDTPPQPLRRMELRIDDADGPGVQWRVIAINTVGAKSE